MKYDFVKSFYEKYGNMDFEKYQETAYDMIQYGKDKLGKEKFSKYFYNSIMDMMKLVDKKYGGICKLLFDDTEMKEELRWKKEIKKEQCIFLTFLIMIMRKNEMEKENSNSDNYKREYVGILNEFYRANGMEILVPSCMDDAILYFSLATQQPWKNWIDMQVEWSEHRGNDDEWHRKHTEWRSLRYSEFKERVRKGLSESTMKTQNTYLEADKTIAEIIDAYNKKKEYEKGENEVRRVSEVFPVNIQKVMENAEWRRTWYLYRMICMVIDCQIETIIQNAKTAKASHYKLDEERLRGAIDRCWLRTNYSEIQNKISSVTDEEMEALLRAYFDDRIITAENIVHVFNESLGGSGEVVFVQAKYRFMRHCSELIEEYLNDPKRRLHRAVILEYFKSDEELKEAWDGELAGNERNAYLLCKVMSGETITSKEFLLLVALIVKKQGCREINLDYVYNHILKNCRFDEELDEDREFNKFFKNTFFNINKLCENAQKLEREMLEIGRGAVFYNVIRGKEV